MSADTTAAAEPGRDERPIEVPWELNVPVADLYIVGYGMRLPNDMTLETLAILKRCTRLLGSPPIDATSFGIPPMEDLTTMQASDKPLRQTYEEIVAHVLEAAADGGPVAFATYGSAMVGTLPAHRLLEEAPRRGLTVHVANAVSSFDGIWADFNIEPFHGFQIWDASAFVTLEVTPETKAPLLLPQAAPYAVRMGIDATTGRYEPGRDISELRTYLLRFYPADHVVHIATTAAAGALHSTVRSVKLGDLDARVAQAGATLLVPRLDATVKRLDFEGPATTGQAASPSGGARGTAAA